MESYWKFILFYVIFIQIWFNTQAATKTIDAYKTPALSKNSYLPPIYINANNNRTATLTKTYITKPQHSVDNFNTRPKLKTPNLSMETIHPRQYSSYAPPPSGLVTNNNFPLPLDKTVRLPTLLPNSIKTSDFTKHPGYVMPTEKHVDNAAPMLMMEEPVAVILQPQHNKTIEAAKILASAFLDVTEESTKNTKTSTHDKQTNSTDVFVVKTQKKAYIIPAHLRKEAEKPTAINDLYPLRDQFEKAYTINQFIFVIKPEKINFLNKLV